MIDHSTKSATLARIAQGGRRRAAILPRVRRLNEFAYRLRWGKLEDRRRRGLIRLHELLSGTPFAGRYWMIMGLLLGCMRDGRPIPWDRDSDFGFMDGDLPLFLDAVRLLHIEVARREMAALRLASAADADGTQALTDVATLSRVIDGLRSVQTASGSADRLLAWLEDRDREGE